MGRPDIEIVASHLLTYRGLGMTPIPLRGKIPLVKWGSYTYNPADFLRPNVNIGIKGGLLASGDYLYFLDFDSKQMIADFYEKHSNLICAPLVSTARGFHLWLTSKSPVKTCAFPGGEIRGEGAYVVAPPSVHASGHHYKFIRPLVGMPPMYNPAWLMPEAPKPVIVSPAASTWETDEGFDWQSGYRGVKKGSRHTKLVQIIGTLHTIGKSEMETLGIVMDWNRRNVPPLGIEEVRVTLHKAYETWGNSHA